MFGQMAVNTQVNGLIIKLRGRVSIVGSTVEVMKVAGSRIICTGMASIHGKMEGGTKVPMKGIENMGLESIPGQMVVATQECG